MKHDKKDPWENIQIARPCKQSWDSMTGDEQVRYCKQCKKNVYNISEMTQTQAEELINEKEGKLCVRLFRRADGTVMTRDCPQSLFVPILIASCSTGVAAVAAFFFVSATQQPVMGERVRSCNGPQATTMARVVYATRNIAKGDLIPESALEEREVRATMVPVDACSSKERVANHEAKYDIPAGQIVSAHALGVTLTD